MKFSESYAQDEMNLRQSFPLLMWCERMPINKRLIKLCVKTNLSFCKLSRSLLDLSDLPLRVFWPRRESLFAKNSINHFAVIYFADCISNFRDYSSRVGRKLRSFVIFENQEINIVSFRHGEVSLNVGD